MYFTDTSLIFLDGEFKPAAAATSSLYAQSLHYGYAAFEGIRAYGTEQGPRIFKAQAHYERLHSSCWAIGLPLAYSVEELTAFTYRLLELNNLTEAYIRPLVYVGEPNMGFGLPASSSVFIAAWAAGQFLGDQPLRLAISPYQRPNPQAVPLEAKVSGHYVNSILASNEAKARGYDEALLLDRDGYVAEGPGANFFFEQDGALFTAPAGSILSGITRATICDLAREMGVAVYEKLFTPAELRQATGAFLTGTAAEVIGVASVDDVVFEKPFQDTIGAQLAQRYRALTTRAVAPAPSLT